MKAARALIDVAASPQPPLHLFLGSDAYDFAMKQTEAMRHTITAWQATTRSTDL